MTPEDKDQLLDDEVLEIDEIVTTDEFGEKIETTTEDIMAEIDTPEMTSIELEEITDEHAYPGD